MKKASFGAWLATFLVCFAFWLLITLSLDVQKLIVGAVVCLIASLFCARFFIHESPFHLLKPAKLGALLAYVFCIFPIELIKANWDVARRALDPKLPINPGIVKVPSELKSQYGQAMLADSITLTPGTITMEVAEDEAGKAWYYIHWIDVAPGTPEEQGEAIKGTLEKWVGRIFK